MTSAPPEGLPQRVAAIIDHTLLRPEATGSEIDALCREARRYAFATVCVNGCWVERCADRLAGSDVAVTSVVAFPFGGTTRFAKADEARRLVDAGAGEVDMVAPLGHIRGGDWRYVEDDIGGVVRAVGGRVVKVILETAVLAQAEIEAAASVAVDAGAAFVKTSTGFHPAGGATVEAVALLRRVVGAGVGVKAAGGIRDCGTLLRMVAAGATRIGTSSAVRLVECLGARPLPELVREPAAHDGECVTAGAGGRGDVVR